MITSVVKTRDKILCAAAKLAKSRKVPTVPAICRASGIRSMRTVHEHAEDIARIGGLVRFRYARGTAYFPVWFINP